MLEKLRKKLKFEKSSKFVERVLLISFPTAVVFLFLTSFRIITPLSATLSLAAVVLFNIILLFPLTVELQQIKHYVKHLSAEQNTPNEDLLLSEKESKELLEVINNMHHSWSQKTNNLLAQTNSDLAVLNSLPDPIIIINNMGKILETNTAAKVAFENINNNKNIVDVFESHSLAKAVSKVVTRKSLSENLVFYMNKPVERKIYAHIKQLPEISNGKAAAVISIYDMTKATKIEKMQSDFVANASHELRTPLSVIAGFVETLQTSAKNDKKAQQKFLKIIADQTDYMSDLIENLLSLSKIELNQDTPPENNVNIEDVVDEVVKSLMIKAQNNNMKIVINKQDNLPEVIGDYNQIKQVIQNLTDNAIKYGEHYNDISIKITKTEQIPSTKIIQNEGKKGIAIAVNNKGNKIQPENMARLTERFYRLQEHKDKNIKGTGLGLAIIKHIIIRHKGNITVTSNDHEGTTFTVYLPIFNN